MSPPTPAVQNNWSPVTPRVQPIHEVDRPPLANQLFENRPIFVDAMRRFKDCMAIVPFLRKPGIAVERELAKLQDQAARFPHVYRELAAVHYYLHSALWECEKRWRTHHHGTTNYATLLREVERWRYDSKEQVCLVTFNYDTMLEDAMRQVLHLEIRGLRSYLSHKDYRLIKLHGSINWGRELDGIEATLGYTHQRVIDEITALRISDRYRLVTEYPMLTIENALVFPAISIPIEKKDEFACPFEHVQALAEALPEVTKVITIGWRATEEKPLNMLSKPLSGLLRVPDLLIISGDRKGAEETLRNLSGTRYNSFGFVENGFTGLITEKIELLDSFLTLSHNPKAGR